MRPQVEQLETRLVPSGFIDGLSMGVRDGVGSIGVIGRQITGQTYVGKQLGSSGIQTLSDAQARADLLSRMLREQLLILQTELNDANQLGLTLTLRQRNERLQYIADLGVTLGQLKADWGVGPGNVVANLKAAP